MTTLQNPQNYACNICMSDISHHLLLHDFVNQHKKASPLQLALCNYHQHRHCFFFLFVSKSASWKEKASRRVLNISELVNKTFTQKQSRARFSALRWKKWICNDIRRQVRESHRSLKEWRSLVDSIEVRSAECTRRRCTSSSRRVGRRYRNTVVGIN